MLEGFSRGRRRDEGQAVRVGVFLGLVEGQEGVARVEFHGGEYVIPTVPAAFVPGAVCSILVSRGKPVRVIGAAGTRPVGLDEGAPVPSAVTAFPDLIPAAELSGEDRARLDETVAGLADAREKHADLMAAHEALVGEVATQGDEARAKLGELEGELASARTDFAGMESRLDEAEETLADTKSAFDQLKATVEGLDVPDVSGLASKKELDEATARAESAAKAYAEAQASGASKDAIAEAKKLAEKAKADAEEAAKAYADEKYTVLKEFADGLQEEADKLAATVGENSEAAQKAQADATAAYTLALNGDVALDRLVAGKLKPAVVEALIADLAIIDYLQANKAWIAGTMIKDGEVTAPKLTVTDDLVAKLITGREGKFVELLAERFWADEIAARTATLSRAVVAAGSIAPPIRPDTGDWSHGNGAKITSSQYSTTGWAIRFDTNMRNNQFAYGPVTPVTAGDEYWASAKYGRIGSTRETGGRWFVGVRGFDKTGTQVTSYGPYVDGSATASGGWGSVRSGPIRIPDGVEYVRACVFFEVPTGTPESGFHTTVYDFEIKNRADGRLIVDGAITGKHIAGKIVTADHLAAGAVTAEKLAIQYKDPKTGYGLSILPQGLTLLDQDGEPSVALRTDMDNYFGIIQDGAYVASMSPDGSVTGQTMSANEEFYYRGLELQELLAAYPRGLIDRVMLQKRLVSDGPWALLGEITFTPEYGRAYTAYCTYAAGSSSNVGAQVAVSFDGDGLAFKRSWGVPMWNTNPRRLTGGTVTYDFEIADANVQSDGTATLKFWGRSTTKGSQVAFAGWNTDSSDTTTACGMALHDMGYRQPLTMQDGWAAPLGSNDSTTTTGTRTKRVHTKTFKPAWYQSYQGNGTQYNWRTGYAFTGGSPAGYGALKSMIGFNRSAIMSFCAGADMVSARVLVRNAHTYAGSGATVGVKVHAASSKPSTYPGTGTHQSTQVFKRGQLKGIGLNNRLAALKNGTIAAIGFDNGSSSVSNYAYFDAANAVLEIKVRK